MEDYEIEKKIIETLIEPVVDIYSTSYCTILRFDRAGGRCVAVGEVRLLNGHIYQASASTTSRGIRGSGWCYVPQTHPIMWPPCSFAEFVQRLNDPKTRKKHGLPPL